MSNSDRESIGEPGGVVDPDVVSEVVEGIKDIEEGTTGIGSQRPKRLLKRAREHLEEGLNEESVGVEPQIVKKGFGDLSRAAKAFGDVVWIDKEQRADELSERLQSAHADTIDWDSESDE